jgi:hypothetical protein
MPNKQKKKRNKPYRGVDAAIDRPILTRISAANRNPVSQWWFDHKRIAKPIIIAAVVITIVIILIAQLVSITTN